MAQMVPTVGIDVSEDRLDVAIHPTGEEFSVSNDTGGWRQLIRRLKPLAASGISLEASGRYERGAIGTLLEAALPVRQVNPWKLRMFAKAAGVLAKNDRLDAGVIARFVASMPTREVRREPMSSTWPSWSRRDANWSMPSSRLATRWSRCAIASCCACRHAGSASSSATSRNSTS
ncbi:MAG: transposase [Reyranellaceae bacterium]